jgi:hypothetical protein
MPNGYAIGEIVESMRFTAENALSPTVHTSIRGSTVTRIDVGVYRVDLSPEAQIDPTMRTVKTSLQEAVGVSLVSDAGGGDATVNVFNRTIAGALTDSGNFITVEITRTSVG